MMNIQKLEKDDIVAFMKMKQLELLNILEIGHSVLTHMNWLIEIFYLDLSKKDNKNLINGSSTKISNFN